MAWFCNSRLRRAQKIEIPVETGVESFFYRPGQFAHRHWHTCADIEASIALGFVDALQGSPLEKRLGGGVEKKSEAGAHPFHWSIMP